MAARAVIDRRTFLRTGVGAVVFGMTATLTVPQRVAASPSSEPTPPPLGVTLFGASWCPYCHAVATVLSAFEEQGQIELLTISLDGGPIGVIEEAKPDEGEAAALGVTGVPVTIIFDPATGEPGHVIRGFRGYGAFIAEMRAAAARLSATYR